MRDWDYECLLDSRNSGSVVRIDGQDRVVTLRGVLRTTPPLGMWWVSSIRLDATAHKERSGGLLRWSGSLGLGGSHRDPWGGTGPGDEP